MVCGNTNAQDLSGIEIHGYATQGFVFSSHNNYLTMKSSDGSLQWTEGAISFSDSISDNLRVGIQLRMYQLGQLGGPNVQVDWASGDYKVNDHLGFRAGKVKTVLGLFNYSQDVDAVFLWALLPQCSYPIDNQSFFLAHLGGDVYGAWGLGKRGGRLRYNAYAGEVGLDLNGGYIRQLADAGLVFTSAPAGKTYGADLRWETPLAGLMLGGTHIEEGLDGSTAGATLHIARFPITAAYAEFTRGRYYLAGEYDHAPFTDVITVAPATVMVLPFDTHSWFGMASYRLAKKMHVGSYYSHYNNDALTTPTPEKYSRDFVVSSRYDFNGYFYAKVEEHFLHGTALGYYTSTNPDGLKPNASILALKVGFSF